MSTGCPVFVYIYSVEMLVGKLALLFVVPTMFIVFEYLQEKLRPAIRLLLTFHPEDFITALTRLQEACVVADLKMSDYGIAFDECEKFMHNAREVMGVMFTSDRIQISDTDIVNIYQESWR